jgi:ferrochelatase
MASHSRRSGESSSAAASHVYDALILVSFGGPERPEDIMPFLENVTRGRPVPRDRLLEVAARYERFGGVSPINARIRTLLTALIGELNAQGPSLAVYWGNRNWHPMLVDVVARMADDGVRRALALATSPFGSYSGCRQYVEDIQSACAAVGSAAPRIDKLRLFYNHPGYIEAVADRVAAALERVPEALRSRHRLVFTAHSVPLSMAAICPYQKQLREACALVAERVGRAEWDLVFQSRSGPPEQPWLEPSIDDGIRRIHHEDPRAGVLLAPLGFLCDNMEVVYDLDVEAAELCDSLGLSLARAETVGSHPRFVRMIRELLAERIDPAVPRLALGPSGPWPDACPIDCCAPPRRPY